MQTKVSIVIPCYNKVDYIDEMLQSVYDQDYDNIEVIMVNDGSTDGTKEKISLWESKFVSRGFEVVTVNQKNLGLGMAVHNGCLRVTAEYVCMPDADDLLANNYVSRMTEILDSDESIDWVICNVKDNSTAMRVPNADFLALYLTHRVSWGVYYRMIRSGYLKRTVLENYIDNRITQEHQINIPLIMGGSKPYMLAEQLYFYRDINDSIMGNNRKSREKITNHWYMVAKVIETVLERRGITGGIYQVLSEINIEFLLFGETDDIRFIEKMIALIVERKILDKEKTQRLKFIYRHYPIGFSYHYFMYCYFEIQTCVPDEFTECIVTGSGGRLICCAALGRTIRDRFGMINPAGIPFDKYWDNIAGDGVTVGNIRVEKPQYETLTKKDTVIIFSAKEAVIESISKLCGNAKIYTYSDVVEYIIHREENLL
jgi:glycosyltransferase involved in cell wall biosynthesis